MSAWRATSRNCYPGRPSSKPVERYTSFLGQAESGTKTRRVVLPLRAGNWSLTSLQQRLAKTGGRLLKHARYYRLFLAEGRLPRRLFGATLRRDPEGTPAFPVLRD